MNANRLTNIELCRIVAILMIIGLHYFLYALNGFNVLEKGQTSVVYHLLESFCIIGVNLFIIISSWFSTRIYSINIRKILYLLFLVVLYGLLDWFLDGYLNANDHSVESLVKAVFPFFWGGKWFVSAYIIYLCAIPFLNTLLYHLHYRSHLILIAIMTLLFSIWPSFFPNPPIDDYGYGFMNFVLIYVVINYLKKNSFSLPLKQSVFLFFLSYIITVLGSMMGFSNWSYNNPITIVQAFSVFSIFLNIKIPQSTAINWISSCTFGVFLIHTSVYFSSLFYGQLFKADIMIRSLSPGLLIVHFVICVIVFYIFCVFLESLRLLISRFVRVLDRVPIISIN